MNKKLIRLTEGDLHRIVKESVNKVLNEWGADSPEEWDMKAKKYGNTYNDVYPTRNGVDLYTLSNGNSDDALHFNNKTEAMNFINKYVTDPQSRQALTDVLSQYRKHGNFIDQTSSNLATHKRRIGM